jgi:hypothetical protein
MPQSGNFPPLPPSLGGPTNGNADDWKIPTLFGPVPTARNFSQGPLLYYLSCVILFIMTPSNRHKLAVVLLCFYVPLSLTVGMFHSDEVWGRGNGSATVQQGALNGSGHTLHTGMCLACAFSAGHYVQPDVPLPSVATGVCAFILIVSRLPETSPRLLSARGPPSPLS